MAFWTVKTDDKMVSDGEGGSYIIDSGMYDVTIKHVIVRHSDPSSGKKGVWLDLIVDFAGSIQTIYRGIGIKNNDGSPGFGENMLNKLCIICGAEDGFRLQDPVVERVCTNQKNNEYEEVETLKEFEGKEVTLRMLKRYRMYNGEIKRSTDLKNVFRTFDHASAKEIAKHVEKKGMQYAKELETCHETSYSDGVTPEQAAEYEEARKEGRSVTPHQQTKPHRFGFGGSEDKGNSDYVPF